MVSLIHPEYIKQIEANWKTKLFYNFINEKPIDLNDLSLDFNSKDNFISFIKVVSKKNKVDFSKVYTDFSRRKPSEESPWLHDNFLIFTIIVGIAKFDIDKGWINKVFELRESKNKDLTPINTTFRNLINKNYSSKDNLFEVVFTFQELINVPIFPIDEINNLYNKLSSDISLLNIRDDFLKIIRLRAIDLIILNKEMPNTLEITLLKDFRTTFLKRIYLISKIIYIILVITLVVSIYIYQSKSKANQDFLNTINTILGIFGAGLLLFIKWITKRIREIILTILGYKKIYKD